MTGIKSTMVATEFKGQTRMANKTNHFINGEQKHDRIKNVNDTLGNHFQDLIRKLFEFFLTKKNSKKQIKKVTEAI